MFRFPVVDDFPTVHCHCIEVGLVYVFMLFAEQKPTEQKPTVSAPSLYVIFNEK
jgi:hypothetical protein